MRAHKGITMRISYRMPPGKVVSGAAYCLSAGLLLNAQPSLAYVYDDNPDALLASSHGGMALWDYCYGKSNDAALPVDPRSLVLPGVNAGKAVHFNAYWKECHVDPAAVEEAGHPTTCGQLRDIFSRGSALLDTGNPGVAALFAGTEYYSAAAARGISVFGAEQYNRLWEIWGGYTSRPDNFDQLVSERYGSGFAAKRNPYPLPGEDPALTNGGSGQLPEMFTQVRDAQGNWSGKIGVTCHACHSGTVGNHEQQSSLGVLYGNGSSLADLNMFLRDMKPLGYAASTVSLLNLNQNRGTSNASAVNIAFMFPDTGLPSFANLLGVMTSGSTGSMDAPAWWNMGHRPVKFVDGLFPMDAPRVDAVFYTPFYGLFGSLAGNYAEAGQTWMRTHGPDMNTWVETLKAPAYPLPVDAALAERGAVLFHELNLWAPERHNPVRQPQGNGSCAGCHGAYAPRYVNDTAYLDTPELEGMASYIVPLDIIGTDRRRAMTNTEGMQRAGANNFFGYPSTRGTENDCGPQNQLRLRGDREIGYLAPPLYGIWASAPYLHNGSVPNVWEVLKPQDRKPIWRRVSAPAIAGVEGNLIMGFDTDLARAYDTEKLGWRYDEIPCTKLLPTVQPNISCNPRNPAVKPLFQRLLLPIFAKITGTWNLFFPASTTPEQMENRKIYNTNLYSQGNEGHAFNAVLTDDERRALIEYMKTL